MGDGEKDAMDVLFCHFFQNFHQGHNGKALCSCAKECPDKIS